MHIISISKLRCSIIGYLFSCYFSVTLFSKLRWLLSLSIIEIAMSLCFECWIKFKFFFYYYILSSKHFLLRALNLVYWTHLCMFSFTDFLSWSNKLSIRFVSSLTPILWNLITFSHKWNKILNFSESIWTTRYLLIRFWSSQPCLTSRTVGKLFMPFSNVFF